MFNTSTFDSFSLFLLYTCVPIVGVVKVILFIYLSNFRSNFSAMHNPMSISLIFVSSTFITSVLSYDTISLVFIDSTSMPTNLKNS